ncbi:hypothetical protein ACJJTC_012753 [Scirpophaga incertulas]
MRNRSANEGRCQGRPRSQSRGLGDLLSASRNEVAYLALLRLPRLILYSCMRDYSNNLQVSYKFALRRRHVLDPQVSIGRRAVEISKQARDSGHFLGLIEYLVRVWKKSPLVYCDYHGHSRKKNVFFYGCAAAESWCSSDRLTPDEPVKYLMLPALMHRISAAFALGSCSFRVERERESTARVTVWRHLGVTRSYTMEASFCGFDRGPFKGFHLNTQHLQNVGSDFCEALNGLNDNAAVDIQLTKDLNGELAVDSEGGSGSDSVLKTDSDEDFD